MKDNWPRALERILQSEGGLVDDKKDLGGRTAYGVTQAVYDAYRLDNGAPTRDVFEIGRAEISDIYKSRYWDAIDGDNLPAGIDLEAVDIAVNQARNRHEAPGAFARDLLAQTAGARTVGEQIEQIRGLRQKQYEGIKGPQGFARFGPGWTNRNRDTAELARALSTEEFRIMIRRSRPTGSSADTPPTVGVTSTSIHSAAAVSHSASLMGVENVSVRVRSRRRL